MLCCFRRTFQMYRKKVFFYRFVDQISLTASGMWLRRHGNLLIVTDKCAWEKPKCTYHSVQRNNAKSNVKEPSKHLGLSFLISSSYVCRMFQKRDQDRSPRRLGYCVVCNSRPVDSVIEWKSGLVRIFVETLHQCFRNLLRCCKSVSLLSSNRKRRSMWFMKIQMDHGRDTSICLLWSFLGPKMA